MKRPSLLDLIRQKSARRGSPARSARARTASLNGRSFESVVESSAMFSKCVVIERVPNAAKEVGGGEIARAKSPFDYAGTFQGGRAIMFDAKTRGKDCASFVARYGSSTYHQVLRLRKHQAMGAVAGFLVRCERHDDYRWIWAGDMPLNETVGWDDPRWLILGSAGGLIDFGKLAEASPRSVP